MLITPSQLSCANLSPTGVRFCFADVCSHAGVLSSITIRSYLAEGHADLTDSGQKGVCFFAKGALDKTFSIRLCECITEDKKNIFFHVRGTVIYLCRGSDSKRLTHIELVVF